MKGTAVEYTIVIPSYRREHILRANTLKVLDKTDVECDIVVFTADEEETARYKKVLPENIQVVTGVRGIPNQRNFIQKYYPVGKKLVFIDDDISSLIGLNEEGKRVKATKLHDFFIDAFKITEVQGMKMFGINSTNSNLEMKFRASIGRIYLVGNFYGLINTHTDMVDTGEEIPTRKDYKAGKESHERALQHWERYGGVIKFRSYGVVSKYWGVPGGHQVSRTADGEKEATLFLNRKYPDATDVRIYKGVYDLVIKAKTKVMDIAFIQD